MSLIKKPYEISAPNNVKILIYGQPGIWKTTIALSAPAPVLLDFDGGVHRIRQQDVRDTVQVRSWKDVLEFMEENLAEYKTIVIDTAGKMLDFMGVEIVSTDPKMGRKDGALTLQGYGVRKSMFQAFVAKCSTMGKHLVFVAHEKEEKDGDTKIIRPEIGGSSAGDLIKELDLVGYMEASGKIHTISFDPCEKFYGKNTCGMESQVKLPNDSKDNNFLSTVIQRFAASAEIRAAKAKEYHELMESIRHEAQIIIDADGANGFADWIKGQEAIWDSKFQAAHLLRDKAAVLGLTLNKDRKYETAPVALAEVAA